MTSVGRLPPLWQEVIESFILSLIACSVSVVDRGVLLHNARRYVCCTLLEDCVVLYRHYYFSSDGKRFILVLVPVFHSND
jgi:hypothetical protein